MALVSRFGEPEQGLLLDLPDVVEEVSGTRNDPEETALIGEENEDSSQVQSEEQEK